MPVQTINTTAFQDQKPGSSGMRKTTKRFLTPGYLEIYVRSIFDAVGGLADKTSAISVGNVHLKTDNDAEIDKMALNAIENVTNIPLVLHGGSGISGETRQRLARETRVSKFDIGTELRNAFREGQRRSIAEQPESFDRIELLTPTIEAVKTAATDVIRSSASEQQ